MKHEPAAPTRATNDNDISATATTQARPQDAKNRITASQPTAPGAVKSPDPAAQSNVSPQHNAGANARQNMDRGLTAEIHPTLLQQVIWRQALATLNRFRVIRAVDVALACFPERPFKAALTAAQRAMRGLAKAGLVRRYRTDRFQHVYGLTVAGARWLHDHGVDAAASVKRVADMSNPEHQLWMNFIVLACEARGMPAATESEAMQELNKDSGDDQPVKQGFAKVYLRVGERTLPRTLRPDALAYEADGVTWFEIDRSKRGDEREAALSALAKRIGTTLANGKILRRVVVLARTDRILLRAHAVLRKTARIANAENEGVLSTEGGRHFKEIEDGVFEVKAAVLMPGKKLEVDICVGHVILQLLPTWLPKVRLDSSNRQPLSGWFGENYLPYRRPATSSSWPMPPSPLRQHVPPVG